MKKLIAITAIFALLSCLLTGCRFGGDDKTTTTNPHTLPETTGATITLPTMEPTVPSTTIPAPTTDGTTGSDMTDGTEFDGTTDNGTTGTMPRGRGRRAMPGRY